MTLHLSSLPVLCISSTTCSSPDLVPAPMMENSTLLKPTLHVEVLLRSRQLPYVAREVCEQVAHCLHEQFVSLRIGQDIPCFDEGEFVASMIMPSLLTRCQTDDMQHASLVEAVAVADYTGPSKIDGFQKLEEVHLDIQSYTLKSDQEPTSRRRISQSDRDDDEVPQARILSLPNVALKGEWDSLIYDEALPSQLLRYLARMLGVMKQPGLNLSTFNWNRLCLLHGPPGSGKSTLCRALAQKLSIRLSQAFPQAVLVEVNTNSMLSKYFGESGKLIGALFEKIYAMAQSSSTLVCVVMDEIETIAGSRERVTTGGECSDGLRVSILRSRQRSVTYICSGYQSTAHCSR